MTIFHKNLSISHYFTFYDTTFAVDLYNQGKGFMINVNIYYICISSIPTLNNLIKLDPLVLSIKSLLKDLTRLHTKVNFGDLSFMHDTNVCAEGLSCLLIC